MTPTRFDDPSRGAAQQPNRARIKQQAHYRKLTRWTLQGWLTMFYLAAGYAKLTEPTELLGLLLTWPDAVDPLFVRALGGLELLMALGLVLALAPRVPARAILNRVLAFSFLESLAFFLFHAVERDFGHMLVNAVLVALSVIVFRTQERAS
ncbi:MAG: DoxX family protein [Brevundimonas sp.]|uniref:DoxX family protein n=1 Tax=Brevundimonas sp. TaxID=1871086 RepID=UPI0027331D2C|nr:DoxX family protein [Brevundimonas sp.]MDP3406197.1 DoxX family protein [Brevundimonas sp.]